MRPVSLVFRISEKQRRRLWALSAYTRIRQSEYLREAIADLLRKYGAIEPRS